MTGRRLPALRGDHRVRLLQGGREFFPALIRAIQDSVHEVRLETYIFHFDASGEQVALALEQAAQRGVHVYLVVDGVGTSTLPSQWAQRFDAAGVQWRIFLPLGHFGLLIPSHWRRLHRKLCIVDGQIAFCGGINVLDDWQDPNHGPLNAPRLDFAVRVSGPLVHRAHDAVVQFWLRQEVAYDMRHADLSSGWKALQESVRQARLHPGDHAQPDQEADAHDGARAALLLRDNLRHRTQIERAYRKAIGEAREEIIIANAYFLPGRKVRQALVMAAQRGVRVRLLLQGRYEYFMQFHAVRMVYGVLLVKGIEIYEYHPSFLHAKVAVIDGEWATVGSSNLDPLSLLLAREANIVVQDPGFAAGLRRRLLEAIDKEGKRVDPAAYAHRPWRQRLLDLLALGLVRFAFFLSGIRY